jgi:alkylhydroperoxidase/carboxymuconolactone decarboxylase family protein YurZ
MNKTNLELFKQALDEAVSNQFDKLAAQCDEEIICSEKHKLAMRAIVYGKTETAQTLSPKMKRLIAILVAAALLLTGCAIIFRNEIREVFEEFFVKLTYSGEKLISSIKE